VNQSTTKKLAWIYTGAILLLVTLPINGEEQLLGKLNDNYILQIRLDYFSHALMFIPWVVLVLNAWGVDRRSRATRWGLAIVFMLAFAIFAEYIQWFLPYRTFNINDLAANALGVVLGLLLEFLFGRYGCLTNLEEDDYST